jgi:hypothetical protein
MPGFDGTGPAGMGPMTGRGAGYCGGNDAVDWRIPGRGRGFGPGWGRGGGWGRGRRYGNRFYAPGLPGRGRFGYGPAWGGQPGWAFSPPAAPTPEQETELLRQQAEWLKEQLDAIGQRIEELSE